MELLTKEQIELAAESVTDQALYAITLTAENEQLKASADLMIKQQAVLVKKNVYLSINCKLNNPDGWEELVEEHAQIKATLAEIETECYKTIDHQDKNDRYYVGLLQKKLGHYQNTESEDDK